MADGGRLGDRLRRKRREGSLTQEALADLSGVSKEIIAKIEQGRRYPRLTVLARLSKALDIPLSELVDDRPRLDGNREGASVLAIRDALQSPSLLPGIDAAEPGDPTPLPQLTQAVTGAGRLYWVGEFARLAAMLPSLMGEARLTAHTAGAPAHSLLAQSYDLAAALMVHMGKEDLAALAAERAVTAATASGDELLQAILRGSYSWVLLHQGRLAEAEQLAVQTADSIEPAFSAPAKHVAVWGSLLMSALASAAASGNDFSGYLSLASAAGERPGHEVHVYQSSFGPALMHAQACHAYAVTREPAKALTAARKLHPGDLAGISYGRHLLDVAQAHTDARHHQAATMVLTQAHKLAPIWFRHQGIARCLVTDLCGQQKRLSPALRELATAVDPDWYAPYHRPSN